MDSNQNDRRTLANLLEDQGYAVVEADNDDEALGMLGRVRIGAVISELSLAPEGGLSLLSGMLKADPEIAPLFFYSDEKYLSNEVAMGLGARGVFAKARGPEALLQALDAATNALVTESADDRLQIPVSYLALGRLEERDVGRGGFRIPLPKHVKVGDQVTFNVEITFGENYLSLLGRGVVRWERVGAASAQVAGLEILAMDAESLILFRAWLKVRNPSAYIPPVEKITERAALPA